ncbi:hypothetical protein Xhom_01617 [Xenorhabdus hominickii]|uniref:Uncharacterized protein n=1 Tax=Xenorhabdus hominickii TaxID=351679 RepID=A0A2G0QAB1_XENHO|nr:hypothetical protein Xhom_01617 [Xenorhabdus hominickii]
MLPEKLFHKTQHPLDLIPNEIGSYPLLTAVKALNKFHGLSLIFPKIG